MRGHKFVFGKKQRNKSSRVPRTGDAGQLSNVVDAMEYKFYCPLLRLKSLSPPCRSLKSRPVAGNYDEPFVMPKECQDCDGHPPEWKLTPPEFKVGKYYSLTDLKHAVIMAVAGYGAGAEVRRIRESLDLDPDEAADAIGLTRTVLERVELHGSEASVSLAGLLGLPSGYKVEVTGREEEPFRYVPVILKHRSGRRRGVAEGRK
jgi:hypothetical protein